MSLARLLQEYQQQRELKPLCLIALSPDSLDIGELLSFCSSLLLKNEIIYFIDLKMKILPEDLLQVKHFSKQDFLKHFIIIKPSSPLLFEKILFLLSIPVGIPQSITVIVSSLVLFKSGFLFRGFSLDYRYILALMRKVTSSGKKVLIFLETRNPDPEKNVLLGEIKRYTDLFLFLPLGEFDFTTSENS